MQPAAATTASAEAAPPVFSKNYRAWLLFILLLTNALNLADQDLETLYVPPRQ